MGVYVSVSMPMSGCSIGVLNFLIQFLHFFLPYMTRYLLIGEFDLEFVTHNSQISFHEFPVCGERIETCSVYSNTVCVAACEEIVVMVAYAACRGDVFPYNPQILQILKQKFTNNIVMILFKLYPVVYKDSACMIISKQKIEQKLCPAKLLLYSPERSLINAASKPTSLVMPYCSFNVYIFDSHVDT